MYIVFTVKVLHNFWLMIFKPSKKRQTDKNHTNASSNTEIGGTVLKPWGQELRDGCMEAERHRPTWRLEVLWPYFAHPAWGGSS